MTIISYLQELPINLLLTTGVPRQITTSLSKQNRCRWNRPRKLPKNHTNQKYKALREQSPVFHKMIYQNDAHVVMINEADALTEETITDIVHHGSIGVRVKNIGAPAV